MAAIAVTTPPVIAFAQTQPSAVDLAQARELLNRGLKLRQEGDIAGAVEKLKAAHALANTPITGLELAQTYALEGKLVEAREACLSVARIPKGSQETSRSGSARSEADRLSDQLADRIPSLRVNVTGVPKETVSVTIDDAVIPTEALDAPRLVDPGSHKVVARSTSGGMAETTVELREKESRDVDLQIAFAGGSSTPSASAPPPPSTGNFVESSAPDTARTGSGHTQRLAGIVVGGVGIAGLGVGIALGFVAKSKDNTAQGEPFPARHDDSLAASHLATGSTVVFCVGAAAVAAGVVLWLTAPSDRVALATNGQQLLLRGTF